MALAKLNGSSVVAATICMPRVGCWHADLEVDLLDGAGLDGAVTLTAGKLTLQGSARRTGTWAQTTYVRVVGGGGGLQREVTPKAYRSATARIVLGDLLSELGEQLGDVAADLLGRQLPAWVRVRQTGGAALTEIGRALGVGWRVMPDGRVWLGADEWPVANIGSYELMREWPEQARSELGIDAPALLPGTVLDGRRADYVEHVIAPSSLRTRVWWAA